MALDFRANLMGKLAALPNLQLARRAVVNASPIAQLSQAAIMANYAAMYPPPPTPGSYVVAQPAVTAAAPAVAAAAAPAVVKSAKPKDEPTEEEKGETRVKIAAGVLAAGGVSYWLYMKYFL